MADTRRPIIGISLGDPAGIGPEVVVKAIAEPTLHELCRPLVIGAREIVAKAVRDCAPELSVHSVSSPAQGRYRTGTLDLVDLDSVELARLAVGRVQACAGQAAFEYLQETIRLAQARELDAIATAPIHKESLRAAGISYLGHTEILAALTGCSEPLTMFEVKGLRIFFLTRHVSLRRACELVTESRVLDCIMRCGAVMNRIGLPPGPLAVAGLNPHCGEHGLFGDEEEQQIKPAIREAQRRGFAVSGPIGADSVFHLARQGRYRAVLALYHDQGHIAAKTLDFERTIAVTHGLPFIRTSVDHGTAFDIAGTGIASALSMSEAIRLAAHYATHMALEAGGHG
jgi:4-hydroxythreonine-4-phosphate dehydrogenase